MSDTLSQKPSRLGLYGPVAGFAAVLVALAGLWVFEAGQVEATLKAKEADLAKQGIVLRHAPVKVSGFPFRLFVDLGATEVSGIHGRTFTFPSVTAEALTLSPGDWVISGGQSMGLKDASGQTTITASSIRMSVRGLLDARLPRTVTELRDAKITTQPQSLMTEAKIIALYTRPSEAKGLKGSDTVDVMFKLDGAMLTLKGPLSKLSAQPVDVQWEGVVPAGAQAVSNVKGEIHVGALKVYSETPELQFDASGQPNAVVSIETQDAEPIYAVFGLSGLGGPLKAKVHLKDGKARLSKFDLDLGL